MASSDAQSRSNGDATSGSGDAPTVIKAAFPKPRNAQPLDTEGKVVPQRHICHGYLTKLGCRVRLFLQPYI
jgi:hypothetical protein